MTEARDMGLAATKLHPPLLPDRLVMRNRLGAAIDIAIEGAIRLILASAPVGSGKTTLLASHLAEMSPPSPTVVAWMQVETSDSDPARFWSFLVEAIGRVAPTVANGVGPVVRGSNADAFVVVPMIVNVLAELDTRVVLVVDDYHLIEDGAIHDGMERLIELCPPQLTVVISTRFDPPFRLGRFRVRNQMVEIRGADLRFEPDEAGVLLGEAGQSLTRTLVDQLCGRTEGWAAGLVLAGLSLEGASDPESFVESFSGDDQLVVDYLSDELVASVGDADRRRLLETSVLDHLTGPLVDAVAGSTDGTAWLRETARSNQLLIGLDRSGTWFRYHHLLRDLLRLQAQSEFAEVIPELHARAAAWYESQGDSARAIDHWLSAGDHDQVVRLMYIYGPHLLSTAQIGTLRGILERLGEKLESVPWLALLQGWCDFIAHRYDSAERWVAITIEVASERFDAAITSPLQMNIALGRGDVGSALGTARQVTTTGQLESHTSDLATVAGGAYAWAGQVKQARMALDIAIAKATSEGTRSSRLLSLIYLAMAAFEEGHPGNIRAAVTRVFDTADELDLASYYRLGPAFALRARVGTDGEKVRADAMQACALARRNDGDLMLGYVLALCSDSLIDIDDPVGADLLAEARSVIDRCPDPGIAGRLLERIESRHSVAARQPSVEALVEQLTEREMAVLRYLPTPMSQREIAAELYVSLNTVKTHSSAIYRKLGVGNRRAAVQAARDWGLL